jgi:transposase
MNCNKVVFSKNLTSYCLSCEIIEPLQNSSIENMEDQLQFNHNKVPVDTNKAYPKEFIFFIGIDVSKNKLDYAVMEGNKLLFHQVGKNDAADIDRFLSRLKTLTGFTIKKAVFCMEHTGYYCNHLIEFLSSVEANIVMDNPLHIKRSLGLVRGKTDKSDSVRIALYAHKNRDELKLWTPRRAIISELKNLVTVRSRLLSVSLLLNNPLKDELKFIKKDYHQQNKKSCNQSITGIKADLKEINLTIKSAIDSDPHIKKLETVMTSVPGVGTLTALRIIIATNEFREINNPKKFACYVGVVPFKNESGSITRKARLSHFANKEIKSLLHLSAVTALRCDDEIKAYYERKTKSEGKPKLAVINAIRNKIVLRVFACVNQDRYFVKNYERPKEITVSELNYEKSLET